ncbi:MAG TPA: HAMP domain-containing sensor histidine kinase [Clostridia bacterium]|nr:HAMP domain-containing sensor histidine kinase [Clostridia bacterium]
MHEMTLEVRHLEAANYSKNRRTLKKRIRRVIFLCVLVTITLFCALVLIAGINFFKYDSAFLTDYFSSYIAQSMGSDYFLEQMGISSLKELEPNSEKFSSWLENIKNSEGSGKVVLVRSDSGNTPAGLIIHPDSEQEDNTGIPHPPMKPDALLMNPRDIFNVTVLAYDRTIYSDKSPDNKSTIGYLDDIAEKRLDQTIFKHLLNYFSAQSGATIIDKDGTAIATVTVKVNSGYLMAVGLLFIITVVLSGLLAMITGLLISRLLTIPVTVPLKQLNEKISTIASASGESAMTSHISMKKPLREISMLADSTNSIMEKMKEYNELLIAQNEELEAQNEELGNSKKKVEEAQNMLIQTENMASVGQLTAAITHEINTPLGAISSNAQLCSMLIAQILGNDSINGNNQLLELLEQLQESNNVSIMACNRVNQIIRSLKNFSKVDQAEFQEADINEGIKSVLVLTSNLWKRKIVIHEEYGDIPKVKCFPGMLNQVLMNLVVNSVQAVSDNGNIFIKTWNDENNVYISVRDDGCGISEENLPKVFDNGFTTKGSSLGMGLGLSISRSIMEKHNGSIAVNSRQGEGAEFIISIPLNNPKT